MIYQIIKTQIDFGVYRKGDRLPTLEEGNALFFVSVDTMRAAYARLKQEGIIDWKKNVGATVKLDFSEEETEKNIRRFFLERRNSLPDVARSMRLLFGKTQWLGYRCITPEELSTIKALSQRSPGEVVSTLILFLQTLYGSLGNEMLMRLVWRILMFLLAPFFSVRGTTDYFNGLHPLPSMLELCEKEDWKGLRAEVEAFQSDLARAVELFYRERISGQDACREEVPFQWSVYRKSSQICYTLGTNLLVAIVKAEYPAESYLPSLEKLAAARNVSVSTMRRTLSLLNKIGVTESVNGLGTRILPLEESYRRCDFGDAQVQKRLLEVVQSLHLLTCSCRAVSEDALAHSAPGEAQALTQTLERIRAFGQPDLVTYACLEAVSRMTGCQAVRDIYRELLKLLFWGYPIRGLHGKIEQFSDYLEALHLKLKRSDHAGFAEKLESLLLFETHFFLEQLNEHRVAGAERLVLRTREP